MRLRRLLEESTLVAARALLTTQRLPSGKSWEGPGDNKMFITTTVEQIEGKTYGAPEQVRSSVWADLEAMEASYARRFGPTPLQKLRDHELVTRSGRVLALAKRAVAIGQLDLDLHDFERVYDLASSVSRLGGVL